MHIRPLTRICSSLRSHNCGLSPSLCYGSRLTQLVPRWFALLLKGRGWFAVKLVMLNLFQHLATVIELQVGFTNPTAPHRSFKPMKTRNIRGKAPHPNPSRVGGSFRHIITTTLRLLRRMLRILLVMTRLCCRASGTSG